VGEWWGVVSAVFGCTTVTGGDGGAVAGAAVMCAIEEEVYCDEGGEGGEED